MSLKVDVISARDPKLKMLTKGRTEVSEQCSNCRFWWNCGDNESGSCRIRAPIIAALLPHIIDPSISLEDGMWPWTNHEDWCGEYQPIAVASEADDAISWTEKVARRRKIESWALENGLHDTRARKSLSWAGIDSMEKVTVENLTGLKNCGAKTIKLIMDWKETQS